MTWRLATPALGLLLAGCVPPYEPPRADQPHAVIKLRRSYDKTAGTHLTESANVNENYVLRETGHASIAQSPLTDSFLAHPIPGTISISSEFHHQERRMVSESYRESRTTYRSESYDCSSGFGSNKSYRSCSRSVPHTEYVTKYRNVMKQVQVSDGECARQISFAPQADHVYLLQYTYQAPGVCRISCFEQLRGPDSTFQNRRCPQAPLVAED